MPSLRSGPSETSWVTSVLITHTSKKPSPASRPLVESRSWSEPSRSTSSARPSPVSPRGSSAAGGDDRRSRRRNGCAPRRQRRPRDDTRLPPRPPRSSDRGDVRRAPCRSARRPRIVERTHVVGLALNRPPACSSPGPVTRSAAAAIRSHRSAGGVSHATVAGSTRRASALSSASSASPSVASGSRGHVRHSLHLLPDGSEAGADHGAGRS